MQKNKENFFLTICITHFNDADFILNTLYCLKALTKNNYKVIIRDNNSHKKNYFKLKKGIKNYENVYLYKPNNFNKKGSLAHGEALNDLVFKINTPYGAIFDADCTFLIKNWDEILLSKLNNKVKIAGTQISRKGVGDFPFMVGVIFETETFKKLNIDFRPGNMQEDRTQDTGWQLREKYLNAGFLGKIIELKNTRIFKQGPFRDFLGVGEYYLDDNYENIFAAHFGRGSFSGASKYAKGTVFFYRLPLIGKLLRKIRGRKDKNKWIKICQIIATQQAKL